VLARFWMVATSLLLLLGMWLYILFDAVARARRVHDSGVHTIHRWTTCSAAVVVAWLVFAGACLYALQVRAKGRLIVMTAASTSMEPTLQLGEFFLADATFYRGDRQPSRGEVAVYVHPKQPDLHYVKRIVAIEGDRVAVRAGHAIVNGMAVEEAYVDAGAADAPFADLPEIRVPPGYVFVLGDNRANSVDSRDQVAHGVVPVGNLIGRVTDVAVSRHLPRMGRWVGTPSNP
jgi:signal peptidase I